VRWVFHGQGRKEASDTHGYSARPFEAQGLFIWKRDVIEAQRQLANELKSILYRWEDESDLDDQAMLESVKLMIDDFFDEEVVDFESELGEE
tara:strand:- start:470 stop:745 length:276 start_codon:yes stop_codon:yes gene_type:complete